MDHSEVLILQVVNNTAGALYQGGVYRVGGVDGSHDVDDKEYEVDADDAAGLDEDPDEEGGDASGAKTSKTSKVAKKSRKVPSSGEVAKKMTSKSNTGSKFYTTRDDLYYFTKKWDAFTDANPAYVRMLRQEAMDTLFVDDNSVLQKLNEGLEFDALKNNIVTFAKFMKKTEVKDWNEKEDEAKAKKDATTTSSNQKAKSVGTGKAKASSDHKRKASQTSKPTPRPKKAKLSEEFVQSDDNSSDAEEVVEDTNDVEPKTDQTWDSLLRPIYMTERLVSGRRFKKDIENLKLIFNPEFKDIQKSTGMNPDVENEVMSDISQSSYESNLTLDGFFLGLQAAHDPNSVQTAFGASQQKEGFEAFISTWVSRGSIIDMTKNHTALDSTGPLTKEDMDELLDLAKQAEGPKVWKTYQAWKNSEDWDKLCLKGEQDANLDDINDMNEDMTAWVDTNNTTNLIEAVRTGKAAEEV
ncbi:hypothetical protein F5Y16DRAFT_420364 [Xylariaceae sp. FL0255]|nr:hypothetical protein F5Y16DRAFT_420364 [Xylariaceae sp. FL0255]